MAPPIPSLMSAFLRTLLIVLAYPACAASAYAQGNAESLFRDGNTLFRSGIYETALIRYREAATAGLASPTLYYNTIQAPGHLFGNYLESCSAYGWYASAVHLTQ